jgi:alcohol dehydrogenase (NADP+)
MKMYRFANGDIMPMLGLGTWKSAPGEVYTAVKEAIRIGYRHIDCAAIYGNEHEVGRALAECFTEGLVKREDIWITSKLWNDKHATEDVVPALQKTLADLRLDYLDSYLVHWPVAIKRGLVFPKSGQDMVSLADVPLSATWKGMENAVQQKLTRHIGVSNFGPRNLLELCSTARIKPEVNQIELHPYLPQRELLETCAAQGVHVTAYSPLGSPDRPAGLKKADTPVLLEDPVIARVAQLKGITPAQVLLAWALARNTSVIPKSVHPERLKANLAAADIELTDADLLQIAGIEHKERYVGGHFWTMPGSPYVEADVWG